MITFLFVFADDDNEDAEGEDEENYMRNSDSDSDSDSESELEVVREIEDQNGLEDGASEAAEIEIEGDFEYVCIFRSEFVTLRGGRG
jgi:hypothetical protein